MVSEQEVMADTSARMQKSLDAFAAEMRTIRTGRVNPSLVENLMVDYYGTPTPLNQLASISVPEARMLVIQPWDKKSIADVEKSILKSELGLTPNNDGETIRIGIPTLTEERRRDLVRLVGRKVEDSHIAVRNIRRDSLDLLRDMEKEKNLSQDESRRAQQKLQELTDSFIQIIDDQGARKEKEVMEV